MENKRQWAQFKGFQKITNIKKNDNVLQKVCSIPFDMTFAKPHIDFNYEVQAQLVQDGLDKDELKHYSARWKCYFSAYYDGTNEKKIGVYIGDGGLDVTTIYGINKTKPTQWYFEVYTAVTSETSDHYDWWEFFGGTEGTKTVTVTGNMINVPRNGEKPSFETGGQPTYTIACERYNVIDNYQAINTLEKIKVDDSPGNVLGQFNGTLVTEKGLGTQITDNIENHNYPDLTTNEKTIIKAINEAAKSGGGGKTPTWKDITTTYDSAKYDDAYAGTIWRVHADMKSTSKATPDTFKAVWTTFIKNDMYVNPKTNVKSVKWQNDLGWVQGEGQGNKWGNIVYRNNYYDITVSKVEESSYTVPNNANTKTWKPGHWKEFTKNDIPSMSFKSGNMISLSYEESLGVIVEHVGIMSQNGENLNFTAGIDDKGVITTSLWEPGGPSPDKIQYKSSDKTTATQDITKYKIWINGEYS